MGDLVSCIVRGANGWDRVIGLALRMIQMENNAERKHTTEERFMVVPLD